MATDLLRKPQPSSEEFLFLIVITAVFTGLLIFTDIVVHDSYVKPLVAQCYAENQESICVIIRTINGLPSDAHISIGNAYWGVLLTQALVISAIIGSLRVMFARLAGAKISPMVIFTGLLWFFTASAFFFFGWLDYGYYALRGIKIPELLPWLNDTGLFKFVQQFGQTNQVDSSDLFLLMFIGLGIVISSWVIITHHYKKGTLEKIGIVNK